MRLQEYFSKYRERVNNLLKNKIESLPSISPILKDAMKHGLLLGGKRVRPFLVYSTGLILGAKENILDYPACAIECIHSYSLIHDDLPCMDNDSLRRGQPTVHTVYGEDQGMLAGDALQTLGFEILANCDMPNDLLSNQVKMIASLAKLSGYEGMCGGQSLDLLAENKIVSLDEMEQIHRFKTGALIRCAVNMGVLCVPNVSEHIKLALDEYASLIGLAFQVHDDILDIIGDTETLGKPQGSDIANQKSTYPSLIGLEKALDYEKLLYKQAIMALDKVPYDTSILKEFAQYIVERKN